jgi:gliding motility-associated-like protein
MINTTTNFFTMKQLKTVITFLLLFIVSASFSQGLNCNTATPYCDAPGGASVTFPNNTNNSSESGPNYGCLTTHPNPAWFYFKTTTAGNYIFDLGQGTTCGGTNLDVDFICWGPFTNPTTACNNLTAGNTVDCSYSPSATEVIDVVGAPAGQYYIVLITNYSNSAGCVSFGLQGSSPPTDCSITCASVLSGPGIVSFPSTSPLNGVAATPMPASVACNSGIQNMYATNVTPFGNPITPGVMVSFLNNANTSNSVSWYENSALVGCFGPSASCQNLTTSYSEQLQFSYMSPSATNQFSFCENNTAQPNITNTNVKDLSGGANMPGAPFTWNDDGACQTITIPPGTVRGISTWGSTCGACLTGVTDWGAAQFNPAAASIGTHTITYTFDSQQPGCTPYTTSITITVTNPYNAAFTTPGPFCAGAACVTLNPSNTYTVGTGTFAGTGISGNSFCPATAGVGTFPITYTVGVSPTCRASQTNNIVVNANPTANAGSPAALTCLSTNTTLTGSGGGTYSWTGPAGGISAGANSATPTVSLAGTYTLLVANGTCTNSATVSVSQNTATPTVAASVSNTLTCTNTSINANATTTMTPVSYNWSGPGITGGAGTGTISANQAGTYNYTVTNTSSGCRTIGSLSVSQNTATPVVAAASSSLNCVVTSVNASATTATSPVSYNWNGPGITAGAGTGTITLNQPGTYNYTVTNTSNGCSTIGSQAITQNTTVPTVNVSGTQTITCASPTVTLIGSSTPSTATPVWSGGVSSGANSFSATAASANVYTLTVTNPANGCSAMSSVAVVPSAGFPNLSSPAVSNSITCTTGTAQAVVTTTTSNVSYSWSGTGITSSTNTPTITVNAGGTYSLVVTNTLSMCSSSITAFVPTNTNTPVPSAVNATTLNCFNSTAALTGAPTSGVTYQWSGPGFSGGTTSQNATATAPGTYTLVVINPINTCSAQATVVVTQNTVAPSVTSAASATLTCLNSNVNASATTTTSPASYNWSGTGIISATNISTITVNQPGTFNYTVTNTTNGCSTTGSQVVTQNISTPSVASAVTGVLNCTLTSVNASATTTTTPVSYNWSGVGITSATNISTITVNQPGTFNYTVTNTSSGCSIGGSQTVTQNTATPVVTSAVSSVLNCTTTSVNASATTTSTPVSYNWSGTGITSASNISTITVNQGGTYNYTVTNTSNGCRTIGTQAVTQNTTAPSASATGGTLTCQILSETLLGGPATGVTYSWAGPGLSGATNLANATATATGNYTLTTTSTVNGCTNTAVSTVTNNLAIPNADAGLTQTLVCGVPSVTLSGSSTTPGATGIWTGGVCGSATSLTTTACAPGTYSLLVTHPVSGCTNTSTVSVSSSTNVPQATTNAVTNSITCTNSVVAIGVTLTNPDPVSYSWSGPGVSGSTTTAITSASLAGTYSVVITNTVSNCQSIFNIIVPDDLNPVSASVLPSASLTCLTSSVTLSASPTGTNYAYVWSGPGTISNGTTDNATVDAGGNYVVTITNNINGCSGSFTVNVPTNTITPTFTLGTASSVTTTCASPNATLSATSSSDPNTIYNWLTPSSTTVTGSPIFVSAAGIYTVVITNTVSGCSTSSASSQSTVEVIADSGIPVVTLAANSLSITCSNPTPSVAVTTTASPVSYSWTPTIGIVAGTETTANPVFNAAGTYSVVVTNTASGCASSINSNVVTVVLDNSSPVIALSSAANDGTITCTNTQVTITPTITTSGAGNLTYTWLPSGVTSSTINDATFTSAGIYTITVTNTLTGCVSTSTNAANTFTVYQNTVPPVANITAISTNSTIGCGGNSSTVTLSSAPSSTNTTVTWLPGAQTTPTLDVTSAGIYTLVVVDAVNGCSVSTQYTVNGSSTPPQNVDAGSNVAIPCGNLSTQLNGTTTSTDVVTYDWSGPSASSISGATNIQNPTVTESGVYTLTVTNTLNGCTATATVNVVQSTVTASITANPTEGISPLTVNFDGSSSTGATNYSWTFGDGNVSGSVNPSNIFTQGGSYTVTLIASTSPCSDTATIVIVVNDGLTLEIPNVFTPNGDGSNDIFTIKSTGVKEISLQIFNRWGQKLYEFSGPKAAWDGKTPSGAGAPEGTYFFFVKATGFDDKEIEKNGTVSLFR